VGRVAHPVDSLLAELRERIARDPAGAGARIELVRDGSMRLRFPGGAELRWTEQSVGAAVEVPVNPGNGVVSSSADRSLAVHVALQLEHLARSTGSPLLCWRNRELSELYWGARLFGRLGPDLLAKGRTRFAGYQLAGIDEYAGTVNLRFESRDRTVLLRLTLRELTGEDPIAAWGPIALVGDREDGVADFVGYVLSRNLPPSFTLRFERDDAPPGHLPPDFEVDLLRIAPPDDSAWFHMLFAAPEDVAIVTTCDRECLNLFSFIMAPPETWAAYAPWKAPPSRNLLSHLYQVGLDADATLLGRDRLSDCLAQIARSDPQPSLIVVIDSCLSRLVGEDLSGAIARFRSSSAIPIVPYDVKLVQKPYLAPLADFWRDVGRAVGPCPEAPRAARVGFFGIDLGDLAGLLESRGVEIGTRLFPEFSTRAVRGLGSCDRIFRSSWLPVAAMSERLLAEVGRPVVELPLPYGFSGTVRFLEAIAPGPFAVDRLRDAFDRAVAPLEGVRIGVFGRPGHLGPDRRYGIDLLSVLHELGLRVDLHLFAAEDEPLGSVDLGPDDTLCTFSSRAELQGLLRDGDFPLVYTELVRDTRIPAAGKAPVTPALFRPGLQGSIDTAETLRALLRCRSLYSR
jgi:hypothetical protein